MKRMLPLILIGLIGIMLVGCEKDPAQPENELQLDATAKEMAKFGWDANHIVTSSADIAEVTQISSMLENDESSKFPAIKTVKKQAIELFRMTREKSIVVQSLRKGMSDSLLFFNDDTTRGVRQALYYDRQTGMARFYEVKYRFPNWRNIIYDSAEVKADLNFSLDDSLDDVLIGLYQKQDYKPQFFIQTIVHDLRVTDFENREITGAEIKKITDYHQDWFLSKFTQIARLNPDKSGTLREEFDFKDGTHSDKQVTFRPDNTGEFEEHRRDGTVVSGRFDSYEDDGDGYYEELTDYPTGRFMDKIEKQALLKLELPDSAVTVQFVETKYYGSGKVTTDSASIRTVEQGGIKLTTLTYAKHNGERGVFNIEEGPDQSTVTGNWTTMEGYYLVLNATYYLDGSGHLHYEVYASETDYRNGADPIFVADYEFSPDGGGTGRLTHKGETYQMTFDQSGDATIKSDDRATNINLFE